LSPTKPNRGGPAWKKDQNRRSLLLIPIALGAIALAGLIAILASGSADDPPSTEGLQQVAAVGVTGDALPRLPDGSDPAVGTRAPELTGQTFDATPVVIGDDGRPKVLVFLAHWCPHCQAEVPRLVDWFEANGVPGDVDVYAVATGTDEDRPNFPPSSWLEREGWDPPTLLDTDDSAAALAYGLSAYPFFVALDSDHEVVARGTGELGMDDWERLLDAALG